MFNMVRPTAFTSGIIPVIVIEPIDLINEIYTSKNTETETNSSTNYRKDTLILEVSNDK